MSVVVDGLSGQSFYPTDGLGVPGQSATKLPGRGDRGFDFTQGDPLVTIGTNGAVLTWLGGQPVMDQGLENSAVLALFTDEGWAGNKYLAPGERIGSDFEASARGPLTRTKLATVEQSAVAALSGPLYKVEAVASNPTGAQVSVAITLRPPGSDLQTLLLSRNGQNWLNQAARV